MTNEQLLQGNINFDTHHKKFRKLIFLRFLKEIQSKFISSYYFEGDDRFTKAKQKTFFRGVFRTGIGSVTNVLKDTPFEEISTNVEFMNLIKETNNDPFKVLEVFAHIFDEDERLVLGNGITPSRSTLQKNTYEVTNKNSAFLYYNSNLESGYMKWLPYAYIFATTETIIKKKLSLADPKFAVNNSNNSFDDNTFDDIYKIDATFFKMSPSQGSSLTGNDETGKIDVSTMLSSKIMKADMTNQETLSDIVSFMEEHQNLWYHLMGIRVNVNKKGERNISDEFKSEEVHFRLMKQDFLDQLEIFMEDYKRVHGKELTLVDREEDILDKLQEDQVKIAGQSGNDAKSSDDSKDKREGKDE